MDAINQYYEYLEGKTADLEADEFTRKIVRRYFEEEALKSRWNNILKEKFKIFKGSRPTNKLK